MHSSYLHWHLRLYLGRSFCVDVVMILLNIVVILIIVNDVADNDDNETVKAIVWYDDVDDDKDDDGDSVWVCRALLVGTTLRAQQAWT